jgi:hypothetical protein
MAPISLDPHERPPDHIRNVYKAYQKMKPRELAIDPEIIDFSRGLSDKQQARIKVISKLDPEHLGRAFRDFDGTDTEKEDELTTPVLVYEHSDMPGNNFYSLFVILGLLLYLHHSLSSSMFAWTTVTNNISQNRYPSIVIQVHPVHFSKPFTTHSTHLQSPNP